MKIDKFLSICTFTAILMSSCSDDLGLQPEDKPVAGIGQTLRIGASLSEGDSRLAFTDGAEKVTLGWEADDALKVINSTQLSVCLKVPLPVILKMTSCMRCIIIIWWNQISMRMVTLPCR